MDFNSKLPKLTAESGKFSSTDFGIFWISKDSVWGYFRFSCRTEAKSEFLEVISNCDGVSVEIGLFNILVPWNNSLLFTIF